MDTQLRESISQIQFDCWSDNGKHTPEKSSCQECNNQLTELFKQEITKEINNALLLQFEMDLANLPKYDIIHDLPEEYIAARKLSLEVSIETLKEHKEEQ